MMLRLRLFFDPYFTKNGARGGVLVKALYYKPASWIFGKWEGVVGTVWSWLRIGTGGGRLWVR